MQRRKQKKFRIPNSISHRLFLSLSCRRIIFRQITDRRSRVLSITTTVAAGGGDLTGVAERGRTPGLRRQTAHSLGSRSHVPRIFVTLIPFFYNPTPPLENYRFQVLLRHELAFSCSLCLIFVSNFRHLGLPL